MISALGSALTALSSFGTKMNVTANNVANVNTDGFKKSRTLMRDKAAGGVEAIVDRVDTPGIPKEVQEDGAVRQTESSNVDLAEELTDMVTTPKAYGANLKTIQTADAMLGSLLDIKG